MRTVPVENGTATIKQPGTYSVTGEGDGVQIIVDVDKTAYPDAEVEISLEGVKLTNTETSPVYIASCGGECRIIAKNGTENVISDGTSYTNADGDSGAVYSKDDLKIKGKGTLIVNGNCTDGIVCKDDLKIWNGNVTVNAVDDGIRGKDSVKIGDADDEDYSSLVLTVNTKQGDGIKSSDDSEDGGGVIVVNGGTVKVDSYADGFQAYSDITVNGGKIDISTFEGSSFTGTAAGGGNTGGWGGGFGGGMGMDGNSNKTDISAKGMKSGSTITINGGEITINSSDDCIHCGETLSALGGKLILSSADDALHSDKEVNIGKGTANTFDDVQIYIPKCYEGVEGAVINQNSGTVYVVSADDGYNAAGGADSSGNTSPGGWGGGFGGGTTGTLNLKGGLAIVNSASGDHDAFDSNGNLTVTGGYYFANGNESMDKDGTFSNTGGNIIAMSAGNTNLSARYTFADSTGKVIVSFIAQSGNASKELKDTSLKAYTGGTVTGGTGILEGSPCEIYTGGTITGGTEITSAASFEGGFGGRPGGRF